MEYAQLVNAIVATLQGDYRRYKSYEDMLAIARMAWKEDDKNTAYHITGMLKKLINAGMRKGGDLSALMPIYKEVLHFESKDILDSYLLYLEIDREPKDRFYQPRRKIMYPLVCALQDLADDKLDELFLTMPPRVGKLLADSTPILTTTGWKHHGDLKVGDVIYSPDGHETKVIAVHPKHHTTHTVTMTDGSQFKCHFRHEWKVFDRRFGEWRLLETQALIGHLETGGTECKRGHRYNFQLPIPEPIEGTHKDFKVAPYTLGAWLGDGTNRAPRITDPKEDNAIVDRIVKDGYAINHVYVHKETGVLTTDFTGLRNDLQCYGMCYSRHRTEKHIPVEYFTASITQRLELLAGLLDTDGCLKHKEHRYEFSTTEKRLADDFIALVRTFGWRTSVQSVGPRTSSSGIEGKKTCYTISFNPTMEIPVVLERKKLTEFSKPRRISIKSIEESEPEQGNCITVERDGMYLAGNTLTPTHNTSLLMFFLSWLIGRDSEQSNLYSAYSDTITSAFHTGLLEILEDSYTYNWQKVFPDSKVVMKNSAEETIDIDRRKRYHSITCRSLYGTLNGACDCSGILISDDLIGGIEEALNPDRMYKAWTKVDNNLITRAKQHAKKLWCGTRWSMVDPTGLRLELLETDSRFSNYRYRVINLPALDCNDESNFDYDYGVGFNTAYYIQRRASFEKNNDVASWNAQYQQQPVEREGTLFTPQDFRFYNGTLPESEPDRIFMAVDPSFGGGDFVAAPVCYQYGCDIYIVDVVYNNGDKRITIPLIVNAIKKWKVAACQVEATKSTENYKVEIEEELKKSGIRINLTTKPANNRDAKTQRIYDRAPEIREEMIFLDPDKREKHYEQFVQNVYGFKMFVRVQHDDAPDALAQAIDMTHQVSRTLQVFRRTV